MIDNVTLHAVRVTAFGIVFHDEHYWHEALRPFVGHQLLVAYRKGMWPTCLDVLDRQLNKVCLAEPLRDLSVLIPPAEAPERPA